VQFEKHSCLPSLLFIRDERQHGSDLPDATSFDHAAGELRFAILAICGSYGSAHAHPSENMFSQNTNYLTDICSDLTTQQLTQINTIPDNVRSSAQMALSSTATTLTMRRFELPASRGNGEVKLGGSVILPHVIDDTGSQRGY